MAILLVIREIFLLVKAMIVSPLRLLTGSGYETEAGGLLEYSWNLEFMRFVFSFRQAAMPRLHVVEEQVIGEEKGDPRFFAYQYQDFEPSVTDEQRDELISKHFLKENNLLYAINATGSDPLNCAMSTGAKPEAMSSGGAWINKVFFRGREVGEHMAWSDGVARSSISQLQVSLDRNHYSYVVTSNFHECGIFTEKNYYAVLDGKRSPVVDAISNVTLSENGSVLSFKGRKDQKVINYILAYSASDATKDAVSELENSWQPDPELAKTMKRSIRRAWFQPHGTATRCTIVKFLLLDNGDVQSVQVDSSSGIPDMDKAAVQAVENAGRFPPFPAGAPKQVWLKVMLSSEGAHFVQ